MPADQVALVEVGEWVGTQEGNDTEGMEGLSQAPGRPTAALGTLSSSSRITAERSSVIKQDNILQKVPVCF